MVLTGLGHIYGKTFCVTGEARSNLGHDETEGGKKKIQNTAASLQQNDLESKSRMGPVKVQILLRVFVTCG